MPDSYSSTAHYQYISLALHDLWPDFVALRDEVDQFIPRPLSDFDHIRERRLARMMELNRSAPRQQLEELAEEQAVLAHRHQFAEKFGTRPMRLLVSALFLSHALCEALINHILVLGFIDYGSPDLFDQWERGDFTDKWADGPKEFFPGYRFDKGGAIYGTLHHLTKQRNIFTHYKALIEVDGQLIKERKVPDTYNTAQTALEWIHRLIALPYDLAILAGLLLNNPMLEHFVSRGKISTPRPHKAELKRVQCRRP